MVRAGPGCPLRVATAAAYAGMQLDPAFGGTYLRYWLREATREVFSPPATTTRPDLSADQVVERLLHVLALHPSDAAREAVAEPSCPSWTCSWTRSRVHAGSLSPVGVRR